VDQSDCILCCGADEFWKSGVSEKIIFGEAGNLAGKAVSRFWIVPLNPTRGTKVLNDDPTLLDHMSFLIYSPVLLYRIIVRPERKYNRMVLMYISSYHRRPANARLHTHLLLANLASAR
jgi:hypothetical protein